MSLVLWFAKLLDPEEREAVLGDLAECGASAGAALREVLGLVMRRQAALWGGWRQWAALFGVALPMGAVLTEVSLAVHRFAGLQVRTYWALGVWYENGLTGVEQIFAMGLLGLGMAVWAWTGGVAMARLAGRTVVLPGLAALVIGVFPLVLLAGAVVFRRGGAGLGLAMLQAVIHAGLLLAPGWLGVRRGIRGSALGLGEAGVLVLVATSLAAAATWTGGWPQAAVARWGGEDWDASFGWQARALRFGALSCPALYVAAAAVGRARLRRVA